MSNEFEQPEAPEQTEDQPDYGPGHPEYEADKRRNGIEYAERIREAGQRAGAVAQSASDPYAQQTLRVFLEHDLPKRIGEAAGLGRAATQAELTEFLATEEGQGLQKSFHGRMKNGWTTPFELGRALDAAIDEQARKPKKSFAQMTDEEVEEARKQAREAYEERERAERNRRRGLASGRVSQALERVRQRTGTERVNILSLSQEEWQRLQTDVGIGNKR